MAAHRPAAVIAAVAIVLTAGLSAAPVAGAAVDSHKVTVGETVGAHHLRAKYEVRPSQIAIMEPGGTRMSSLHWSLWTATKAKAKGAMVAGCGCGVPARLVLTRVRDGHFTLMTVYTSTSPNVPRRFRWTGTASASSKKVWQHKA
jgi:hypothetical protein